MQTHAAERMNMNWTNGWCRFVVRVCCSRVESQSQHES